MKFLIDVQGLHEEPYELPKHAYNHSKGNNFIGEDGRSVTVTDLLFNYFDKAYPGSPLTDQRLIGRELEFHGFHAAQIVEIRLAIELGHVHKNWQPMVDLLAPEQSLRRNYENDPAKQ